MKISNKQLVNLKAETESGKQLGKVESFNIDIDSQSVLEYNIKPANVIKSLIKKDLIISRGQVIEITDKKIIVEDLVVQDEKFAQEKIKEKATQGAIMKEK